MANPRRSQEFYLEEGEETKCDISSTELDLLSQTQIRNLQAPINSRKRMNGNLEVQNLDQHNHDSFVPSPSSNQKTNSGTNSNSILYNITNSCRLGFIQCEIMMVNFRVISEINRVYFIIFYTFSTSIIFGTIFYSYWHNWEISTSFYYASQVLLGNMYGIPQELDSFSETCTVFFFIWGACLIAVMHLVATSNDYHFNQYNNWNLFSNHQNITDAKHDSENEVLSTSYIKNSIIRPVQRKIITFLSSSYSTGICAILWVAVGMIYGIFYEKWTVLKSLYFAVGAMSAAGIPPPPCLNGDDEFPRSTCQLGSFRGFSIGFYLIVGVPLFAFTMGHFAGYIVHSIADSNKVLAMKRKQLEVRNSVAAVFVNDANNSSNNNDKNNNINNDMSTIVGGANEKNKEANQQNDIQTSSNKSGNEYANTSKNDNNNRSSTSNNNNNGENSDNNNGDNNNGDDSNGSNNKNNNNIHHYDTFNAYTQSLLNAPDNDIHAYFLRQLIIERSVDTRDLHRIYTTSLNSNDSAGKCEESSAVNRMYDDGYSNSSGGDRCGSSSASCYCWPSCCSTNSSSNTSLNGNLSTIYSTDTTAIAGDDEENNLLLPAHSLSSCQPIRLCGNSNYSNSNYNSKNCNNRFISIRCCCNNLTTIVTSCLNRLLNINSAINSGSTINHRVVITFIIIILCSIIFYFLLFTNYSDILL